jgi:tRNA-modifying protein YgfZ
MDSRWKQLLDGAGAVFDDDGSVLHFGNPDLERRAAMSGSVICDLSLYGLIRARGPDTVRFLQGQLTGDVTHIDAGHSQLNGFCTPKGRLLALFRVFASEDAFFLRLPAALLEPTLTRLRKYILMSRITLDPAGDDLAGIGLSGPRCEQELSHIVGAVPAAVDAVVRSGPLTVIRTPGIHPRFEIFGPVEAMQKAWSQLDVHAAPVGAAVWILHDILAGVPEIWPETVEEFIPQSVNLDLLGGISFDKGCYTGQEIVARLHYRGTVKRRMYLAECDTAEPPPPGRAVYPVSGGDQAVGQVVSATLAPERGSVLLVSTVVEQALPAALSLGSPAGPPLELRDLPVPKPGADA